MAGILDKKQRIMDFSLTREGYKQIQNGDLRIKYASFSDKFAIYDTKEDSINIADEESMPFSFETFDNNFDTINQEIDILNTSIFNSNINNNMKFITDYQSNLININNGYITFENENTISNDIIFQELSNTTLTAINNSSMLLSDNLFNYNSETGKNEDISIKLKSINDLLIKDSFNLNNSFSLNTLNNNLINNFNNNSYVTCLNNIILDDKSLFEDSRFIEKLPFMFLPPSNMNTNVASKNNNILNTYNFAIDKRIKSKILYKGFKNTGNLEINKVKLNDLSSDELINSIKNIEILSKEKILNYIDNIDLNTTKEFFNNQRILSFELEFEKMEVDSQFLFQMYESNNSQLKFNKLLVIDHGEIFDPTSQKNIQLYSLGKLYHSKIDVDISKEDETDKIRNYIQKDNYLFVNLFTILTE